MINKLTGEPVSAEIQNVLKRLANGENVPEAEIQQLKEIREANSCLGNGVPTVKLKDREGIQNGVYNRLQCSGSAVTDDSGHLSLTGEIRREKRLDIVIGLPASGKSSALIVKLGVTIKTAVLKIAAKAAIGTAKKACGAASFWDCYQPVEPKALKRLCKVK